MITAPRISSDRFSDLVAFVGGQRIAAKVLGTSISELRHWIERQQVPHWAGPLLWFHTSEGQNAVAEDVVGELRYVAGERDALRAERDRHHLLIDETRASLGARLKSLEQENLELRRLLQADVLAEQLSQAQAVLDRLLLALRSDERTAKVA
jgi:hypothetical protein